MDQERFEELLDGLLASYSTVQPLDGLEERVLARARTPRARRIANGRWAVVVMTLLAAAWVVGVRVDQKARTVTVAGEVTRNSPALVVSTEPVLKRNAGETARATLGNKRFTKRVGQAFSLPATDEELLLARFVAAHPVDASGAFAGLRDSVERDVTIEPLRIASVEVESLP